MVDPPEGLNERSADWHHNKFAEFTFYKQLIGEPSPHLAIVGYLGKEEDDLTKMWYLGCYGATYCLPSAQMIWKSWTYLQVVAYPEDFTKWLEFHWKGIITRTERRCVRTPAKMARCLISFAEWVQNRFLHVRQVSMEIEDPSVRYDYVWDEVTSIYSIGRYIAIRIIEGMRRYCDVDVSLLDIRSIGGWSPKKAMCFMYPEHQELLLTDAGEKKTKELAANLLDRVNQWGNQNLAQGCGRPELKASPIESHDIDYYVLAAMLCEYRVAFEKRKQYVGWTIDQEPILYNKAKDYWGDELESAGLWKARAALFPHCALGEKTGHWEGTRWMLTNLLRDEGYNWSDLVHNYALFDAEGGEISEEEVRR